MPYGEAKIYHDGSHYIAIPHTTRPCNKRKKPKEELINVKDAPENEASPVSSSDEEEVEGDNDIVMVEGVEFEPVTDIPREVVIAFEGTNQMVPEVLKPPPGTYQMTKKELFDELYQKHINLSRKKRKKAIYDAMRPYFQTDYGANEYVTINMERKYRNLIERRKRMVRKINLQEFNYFCTFTYDGEKHSEESFKKKLSDTFKKMTSRRGWKYAGVWERSPEKQRLHFHGLFSIPEGGMPGELIEVTDYSPIKKHVQKTIQNTYFNERFGRSDFKPIEDRADVGDAIAYLMKYLEKSGEKIVYSRNMPEYVISDILDDDVITTCGIEDRKLVLFDDFSCIDNGEYLGPMSKDMVAKLRHAN